MSFMTNQLFELLNGLSSSVHSHPNYKGITEIKHDVVYYDNGTFISTMHINDLFINCFPYAMSYGYVLTSELNNAQISEYSTRKCIYASGIGYTQQEAVFLVMNYFIKYLKDKQ